MPRSKVSAAASSSRLHLTETEKIEKDLGRMLPEMTSRCIAMKIGKEGVALDAVTCFTW